MPGLTHGTVTRTGTTAKRALPFAAQPLEVPTNPFTGQPMNLRQAGFVQALANRPKMKPARPRQTWDVTTLEKGAEVLLIRQHGLGDALMMVPLLRAMAARGIVVDFQTAEKYAPLFEGLPYLRSVAPMSAALHAWKYDLVINLDESDEPAFGADQNRIRHYGRCIGLDLDTPEKRRLEYTPTEAEMTNVQTFYAEAIDAPRVAFVWKSRSSSRDWSNPTRLKAIHELTKAGASVLLMGETEVAFPGEQPDSVMNLCGHIPPLRHVAALLAWCDGVITPDTGTFHLAAAMNLPTLTYFGPFAPQDRFSGAEKGLTVVNTSAAASCPYAPCRAFECPFADVNGQSPCLAPDWSLLRKWVEGLKIRRATIQAKVAATEKALVEHVAPFVAKKVKEAIEDAATPPLRQLYALPCTSREGVLVVEPQKQEPQDADQHN
jgi:ADP-heptose:LPS heptosyltransferase